MAGGVRPWEVFCNSGDKIVGGGYFDVDETGTTVRAIGAEDFYQGYQVQWTSNDGTNDQIVAQAYRADLQEPTLTESVSDRSIGRPRPFF